MLTLNELFKACHANISGQLVDSPRLYLVRFFRASKYPLSAKVEKKDLCKEKQTIKFFENSNSWKTKSISTTKKIVTYLNDANKDANRDIFRMHVLFYDYSYFPTIHPIAHFFSIFKEKYCRNDTTDEKMCFLEKTGTNSHMPEFFLLVAIVNSATAKKNFHFSSDAQVRKKLAHPRVNSFDRRVNESTFRKRERNFRPLQD